MFCFHIQRSMIKVCTGCHKKFIKTMWATKNVFLVQKVTFWASILSFWSSPNFFGHPVYEYLSLLCITYNLSTYLHIILLEFSLQLCIHKANTLEGLEQCKRRQNPASAPSLILFCKHDDKQKLNRLNNIKVSFFKSQMYFLRSKVVLNAVQTQLKMF